MGATKPAIAWARRRYRDAFLEKRVAASPWGVLASRGELRSARERATFDMLAVRSNLPGGSEAFSTAR